MPKRHILWWQILLPYTQSQSTSSHAKAEIALPRVIQEDWFYPLISISHCLRIALCPMGADAPGLLG